MALQPRTDYPFGLPLDGQQKRICHCGELARYCFLAELDEDGNPAWVSEFRQAICRNSKCDFQVEWKDRNRADHHNRCYSLKRSSFSQHAGFEDALIYGDRNRVGNELVINQFNFKVLQEQSAEVSVVWPQRIKFEIMTQNSEEIRLRGVQSSYKRSIRTFIISLCSANPT
ncbi:hypothetical protein GGS26DRAFT_282 [Hypomontagnella submonticulosa]|nr:hypothetical protein GGS26DRAFT_282 [Hypomontagnella submonticulosa]